MIKLEKYFSQASRAFETSSYELRRSGLKEKLINEFIIWRQNFKFEKIENELAKENIKYITWHDQNYPKFLKEISFPPYIIYYRGNIKILNDNKINQLAIVGSRKHSAYAEKIIKEIMPTLVYNNIKIISGLALGVDTLAHQEALNNKGLTIAILGSGINYASIYPRPNRQLAEKIINNNGLILSEFPPQTQPLKQNFPQRNRIISGLSQAVLVIEAKEKSGALITADYALDQNREVLAIPGNIFSEFSRGTNNLIKAGAKTITKIDDILEIFKIDTIKSDNKKRSIIKLKNEIEKQIYAILKQANERAEKISVDEIIKITKLDTALINSTLSILELRGIAKSDGISYDIN